MVVDVAADGIRVPVVVAQGRLHLAPCLRVAQGRATVRCARWRGPDSISSGKFAVDRHQFRVQAVVGVDVELVVAQDVDRGPR